MRMGGEDIAERGYLCRMKCGLERDMIVNNRIEAYHGTSVENAARIQAGQYFKHSKSDHEWLGHGIYFFAYRTHAEQWIKEVKKLRAGKIVTVQLEYTDRELLDLDDPAQLQALNAEVKRVYTKVQDVISVPQEGNKKKQLEAQRKRWCFVCNLYRDLHPEIGIIFYTFSGNCIEPSLFRANQKQICVSQDHIIKEII